MVYSEIFFKNLLDNLSDGIYFVDLDRRITYWNRGAERITGFTAESVVGTRCMDNLLIHVDANGTPLCTGNCPIVMTMTNNVQQEAEVFLHHKGGQRVPVFVRTSPIVNSDGKVIGAVETFSDNSKMVLERKRYDTLKEEITKDTLTGIPTRQYMNLKLKNRMIEFQEFETCFGLLFVDIDHFKLVNDNYGHAIGDEVLKMIANTLDHNIRSSDYISRWGGEEFVGLINHIDLRQLTNLAEKLRMLVQGSQIYREDDLIGVTVSIGGTLVRPGDTVESIIQRADQLMYQCKSMGRNRILVSE